MRAPAFWQQPASLIGKLLAPLGAIYDVAGKALRARITPQKLPVPVICVGNITLGGAGKTPVVMELARRLRASQVDAHILSRGYGGKAHGPLRVDPAIHTAEDVGDEPLLLAEVAPVWVARNKLAGAQAAIAGGAKLLILDDGLQNPSLHKDFSFLVVDGTSGLGNGLVFPAGPLRERPEDALPRIDAVVWIGTQTSPIEIARTHKTFLRAVPETYIPGLSLQNQAVFAFCGIGNPQKFFDGLKAQGADLRGQKAFADHHPYSRAEIEALLQEAAQSMALAATTAKDAVRIPPDLRARITVCQLRLAWQNEPTFESVLRKLHGLAR